MKNYYYDDFRCCELRTVVKEVIEEKGFYWTAFENTIFFLGAKIDALKSECPPLTGEK